MRCHLVLINSAMFILLISRLVRLASATQHHLPGCFLVLTSHPQVDLSGALVVVEVLGELEHRHWGGLGHLAEHRHGRRSCNRRRLRCWRRRDEL